VSSLPCYPDRRGRQLHAAYLPILSSRHFLTADSKEVLGQHFFRNGASKIVNASNDETRRAIEALTGAEYRRLNLFVRSLTAGVGGRVAQDYVQEAVLATLAGRRPWNKSYPMYRHLCWAIKSEVSNHTEHHKTQRYFEPVLLSSLNSKGEDGDTDEVRGMSADDFPSSRASPEEELEAKRQAHFVTNIKCQMAAILGHGSMGHQVFQLKLDGVSEKEICRELKLTKTQYMAYNMQVVRAVTRIKKRIVEGAL